MALAVLPCHFGRDRDVATLVTHVEEVRERRLSRLDRSSSTPIFCVVDILGTNPGAGAPQYASFKASSSCNQPNDCSGFLVPCKSLGRTYTDSSTPALTRLLVSLHAVPR